MLARWIPQHNEMKRTSPVLVPTVDSFLDEAFAMFRQPFSVENPYASAWPAAARMNGAEVAETENEIQVIVDLPGCSPKSLDVKLEGDTLTVQAERKLTIAGKARTSTGDDREVSRYARSFVLPNTIDGSQCHADYEHGVLTVTLPKRQEAKPRTVDIKVHT